jgi:hypothetical protein
MAKKVIIEVEIEGTQEVLKLQQQIKDTKKELKETEDIKAYDKLSGDLVKLQSNLKEARKQQRQAVDAFTATNEGVGAYSRLSAQLRVARNRLKDLQAEGVTTGAELEELTQEVAQLDTQLKNIDRSVGQTNREVGAYEAAVRKAVGVTDQQTGAFTRLNGRLGVLRKTYKDVAVTQGATSKEAVRLRKEIDKLEKSLKQADATTQRAGTRIGGLRSQVRNLGPAFAGIASGFIAFAEIPQAIENLGELARGFESLIGFISPTVALNADLRESLSNVSGEFVKEKGDLDALFEASSADNENKEQAILARNKLLDQYGPLLSDLAKEELLLGNVALAQREATDELIKNLAEREAQRRLAEDIEAFADAEAAAISLETESQSVFNSLIDFGTRFGGAVATLGATEIAGLETSVTNARELLNENAKQTAIQGIEQNAELQKRIEEGLGRLDESLNKQNVNLAKGSDAAAELQKEADAKAAKLEADAEKRRDSARDREAKKQAQQAERLRKQQEQARMRFLADEIKQNEKRITLLEQLEAKLITAEIKNREESLSKLQALEADASKRRIEQLQAQADRFEDEAEKQQAKVNAAFGEGSQQALDLQKKLGEQSLEIVKTTDGLIEQERIASTQRLAKIEEDFNKKQADEAKKQLDKRLAELQKERQAVAGEVEQELLTIREARAKGNIDAIEADNQAFAARVENLKDQLAKLDEQEEVFIELGIAGTDEQFKALLADRQQLNTQLAELEEEQTAKTAEESKKRGDKIREDFEKAAAAFSQSVQLVGQIADLANQKVIERIEKDQEEQEATIMALEERLQTASGLEAKFLEESIAREEKAAEELAQKKIRAEKEALIAKKAVSITEAVINTALAISSALTAGPPLGFILAGLAGALGAVQIATIAAQPVGALGGIEGESFALGGMVVGKSHAQGGEKFAVGGRVVELEGGEAVINKRSTAMFRNQLSDMNAAGGGRRFQTGGIAGAPMQAPRITREFDSQGNLQAVVEQNSKLLQATNSRIDRIKVEYTTATDEAIQEDKQDRKEIQTTATL